jgi:hypothetical protein
VLQTLDVAMIASSGALKMSNIPTWQLVISGLGVLVSLIGGGLSGALVNSVITKRRHRLEIALKITDYFFSIYGEVGTIVRYFHENDPLTNPDKKNRVLKIGDWYELVLTLCRNDSVDVLFLGDSGLIDQIDRFRNFVQVFRTKSDELNGAWAVWVNIQGLNKEALLNNASRRRR